MAKALKTSYVCSECGHREPKWTGKCPDCGAWDSFIEETVSVPTETGRTSAPMKSLSAVPLNDISFKDESRYKTGLNELDRVLGGGIVKGSLILLGGDPGVGKSTILLQICEYLGQALSILYVSGEESRRQIKIRASRLGVSSASLSILTETDILSIADYIEKSSPDIVIIDSIQTMNMSALSSSPGTVAQVRECTSVLQRAAKALDIPIFVVGHVNKDGNIAGPKVLEHIVDVVLYLEGDRGLSYRMLRAVKNRYGATNEIGVFEMSDSGLEEVLNPSEMLLSGRPVNTAGSCVACVMEGTRPILAEVQALVSKTGFGNPRRVATGFDYNRLNLILAILEKRAGYYFSNLDVYVNVVGGFRLDEPAADLTVALSLMSGMLDIVIPEDIIAFGELGLAGETRAVNNTASRIAEAKRLGFKKCIIPVNNLKKLEMQQFSGIEVIGVKTIGDVLPIIRGTK
ncbi:MAG TPA: DNA repair protein RadA [Firmicutes bacterium]|nr:DNA repair protein RadA [Bacillota bacterium]